MKILKKYITADEFREYTGVDLDQELRDTSNPSNKVSAFLMRVEDRMEVFMNTHFFKNVGEIYPKMTDEQKAHYKLALIEQAYYIFKNGDIYSDSGYDPDKGIIASKHALTELTIAPAARDHLRMTGLWTSHIGSNWDFYDVWFGNR